MYILRRLIGFGFLAAIYLICAGAYDAFIQAGTRRVPETVSISELEKNVPANRHLIVTGGTPVLNKAVEYYRRRHGVREANSEIYFIPIQDSTLPASASTIPPLLVKMSKDQADKAKNQGGFDSSRVEGVRMTHWDLESKAKDYLVASFGTTGVERMVILDYQREVVGIWRGLGQLIGGFVLLVVLGLASANTGKARSVTAAPTPSPATPNRETAPPLSPATRHARWPLRPQKRPRRWRRTAAIVALIALLACVVVFWNSKQHFPAPTVTPSPNEWGDWQLPIRLGDSIETVRAKLGPESLDGKELLEKWTKEHHLDHYKPRDEDSTKFVTLYWQDRGLWVWFGNEHVREIAVFMTVQPEYSSPSAGGTDEPRMAKYSGQIIAGITPDDGLADLARKLGQPTSVKQLGKFAEYEWRRGTSRVTARIANEDLAENGAQVSKDRAVHLNIEDTAPEAAFEQEQKREEQARREIVDQEKANVALTGAALSSKEIFQRYSGRVVEVQALNSRGTMLSTGTGFLWRGDEIITNCHVIEEGRILKVRRGGQIEGALFANVGVDFLDFFLKGGGKLSHFSAEQDWVQLFLSKKGVDLPQVVCAADMPEVGEAVTVIGNPEGLTNSLSTGIVSGVRAVGGNQWIQITAPVSPGSSGSPVFDSKGQLLGLATMRLIDGQSLNFATPIAQIFAGVSQPTWLETSKAAGRKPAYGSADFNGKTPFKQVSTDNSFEQKKKALTSGTLKDIEDFAKEFLTKYDDPEDQAAIFNAIADAYAAQGEYLVAVKILQKKRERLGTDLDDYSRVAELLDEAGDVVAMKRELREGIAVGIRKFAKEYLPSSRDTASTVAYLFDKLQDRVGAAQWFDIHMALLIPSVAEWTLRTLPEWYQKQRAAREKIETDVDRLTPKDTDAYIDSLRQRWRLQVDIEVIALLRSWGLTEERGKELLRIGIDSIPTSYWEQQIRPKVTQDQWLLLRAKLDERKSL